jgi:hypothetical protein
MNFKKSPLLSLTFFLLTLFILKRNSKITSLSFIVHSSQKMDSRFMILAKCSPFIFYILGFFVLLQLRLLCISNEKRTNQTTLVSSSWHTFRAIDFDPHKHKLVFFHIQKTSGSFFDQQIIERSFFVHDQARRKVCRKLIVKKNFSNQFATRVLNECRVNNSNASWYLSWQTSWGWKCSLHPSLSHLKFCTEKNASSSQKSAYFYFGMIREPIARFVSEWLHVRRTGSTWLFENVEPSAELDCQRAHFQRCLGKGHSWMNVTLEEFMSCKQNLAFNRQTRMLALHDNSTAFDTCEYLNSYHGNAAMEVDLLRRAKLGLESLAFFGLREYQSQSFRLFMRTFKRIWIDLDEVPFLAKKYSSARQFLRHFNESVISQIASLNQLDLRIYDFAKELFVKRLQFFNISF